MAKEFAKAFYNSKKWKQCRDSYIASVNGLCERCTSKGAVKPGYILHHKIYLNQSNIKNLCVSLNYEHLEYLCLECHNIEHHRDDKGITREGLIFNEYGDIVSPP